MANKKKIKKNQTLICKALHRKQTQTSLKSEVKAGVSEESVVLTPAVTRKKHILKL